MGGLSKKAFQFGKLIKEKKLPTLIVDGGSLLFRPKLISDSQKNQAKITAQGIARAYNLINYDAVGVGSQDLAAGIDFLLEIRDNSKFDWLSANIISKKEGKPLFKPYISRSRGDIKIGIFGLTNQLPPNSRQLNKNNEIKPWREILPNFINKLNKDHDFIILLTDLPNRECREIAMTYPAINLIVHAKNTDANQLPIKLTETTTMVGTGKKGKYIGIININWYPGSNWQIDNREILAKKEERGRLKRQLSLLKNRPKHNYQYKKLQKRLEVVEATIERFEKDKKSSAIPPSSYKNNFMAMNKSLPDNASVKAIVNETKNLINKLNIKPTANSENRLTNKEFTGWKRCRNCHRDQAINWQKTRHSSFLTLIEKNQQFNLDCLPCHVTEIDVNDPAAAVGLPPELQMVGCETCHGSGAVHSDNPTSNKLPIVTKKICLRCHVPEHDESFNFTRDIKKLGCSP